MTSPLTIDHAPALAAIRAAAQQNTATQSGLPLETYTAAGVTGAQSAFLSAYNSALDSAAVTGDRADTTVEVQAIVDAYNTILKVTDGYGGVPIPLVSAAQFTTIGVTGVSGSSDHGTALHLLDDALLGVGRAAADTVAEVQAMADAAKHVMAATGGTVFQAARLTVEDFAALHITGVTTGNLDAIRTVLRAVSNDTEVDSRYGLQSRVDAILGTSAESAKAVIIAEAALNSANATTLSAKVYAAAGVSGVDSGNLASINSAINSQAFDAIAALHGLQPMVDAYNAILRSADGVADNTGTALTGAQYSAVGVTGISDTATATEGSVLHLLDSVVDASSKARVDTVPELQALADAASHVISAAGGTAAQAAVLSAKDLGTLGITGVNVFNMAAVRMAIEASASDNAVDTRAELQAVVNAALAPIAAGDSTAQALAILRFAAQYNLAIPSKPTLGVYAAAGATGLLDANLASYNSALDSNVVDGAAVYTTAKVQAVVDAYNTILRSTEGGFPATVVSAEQFATVGVTGLSGTFDSTSTLHLVADSLLGSSRAAVDTVPELQARADAANHVFAAAGGSADQARALSVRDLGALGVTGVTADNIDAIRTVVQAISNDYETGTRHGIQTVVNATLGTDPYSALDMIGTEALLNSANNTTLSASVYAHAGVQGVDSGNLASINSALNSNAVTGLLADTPQELQQIVDAYSAILQSADGKAGNTTTPLTSAQYAAVGVTGTDKDGSALNLLDSVVDASTKALVDTVPELQAMADAAHHVITVAGATDASASTLGYQELLTLGITGSLAQHMDAIRHAIQTSTSHSAVDTQGALQSLVNVAIASDASHTLTPAVNGLDLLAKLVDPLVGGPFVGGCIDLRFANCLVNTVSLTDITPLHVGVDTPTPVWGCIFPPALVADIAALLNPPVLAA